MPSHPSLVPPQDTSSLETPSQNHPIPSWLPDPTFYPLLLGLWILALGGLVFLWKLGSVGLVDETEPLFAEAARQMLVRNDWVTPYFNEVTRFDKPPLIYWLMAVGYQVLGVNEWAVRLPSALAAIVLMALLAYVLVQRGQAYRRPQDLDPSQLPPPNTTSWLAAFMGASILAFGAEMIAWGRVGVSDMLLNGFFGATLLCFFQGYALAPHQAKRSQGWYFAAYTSSALAILTKGPIGLVLPGLIILAFLLYEGQLWRVLLEMRVWWGIAWILGLTVPWYVLVIQANGEAYIQSFFGYHNLERFTQVVNHHAAPWYFYLLVVLVGFAPWSIYLPQAFQMVRIWRRSSWQSSPRYSQLAPFALFWFLGVFGFFTIAVTKLPSYVLPLMPAAAILVALTWSQAALSPQPSRSSSPNPPNRWHQSLVLCNGAIWLLLGLALWFHGPWLGHIDDPSMPNLPQDPQLPGLLLLGGAIALVIGGLLLGLVLWDGIRQRPSASLPIWIINSLGVSLMISLWLLPSLDLLDRHRQAPLREIAILLQQEKQPHEDVIMLAFEKPSVVFYSHQPMHFFRRMGDAADYLAQVPTPSHPDHTVLLLTYPSRLNDIDLTPQEYQRLGQRGSYELIRLSLATLKAHLQS